MKNETRYETQEAVDYIVGEIQDREDLGHLIERADVVKELAENFLSARGKFNLAVSLLSRAGRSDLAELVNKEGGA